MKSGSINFDRLCELLINHSILGVFTENYASSASVEMSFSEEIQSTPIIRLSLLLNEKPHRSIIFECNSDGESLRFRNGELKESGLGEYGSITVTKLSPHYFGEITFIKAYISVKKPISLELTFEDQYKLSITNWGDELVVLDKPFLDETKSSDFITSPNIFTYGIDA